MSTLDVVGEALDRAGVRWQEHNGGIAFALTGGHRPDTRCGCWTIAGADDIVMAAIVEAPVDPFQLAQALLACNRWNSRTTRTRASVRALGGAVDRMAYRLDDVVPAVAAQDQAAVDEHVARFLHAVRLFVGRDRGRRGRDAASTSGARASAAATDETADQGGPFPTK